MRYVHHGIFLNDVSMHPTGLTVRHVILDLAMEDAPRVMLKLCEGKAHRVLKAWRLMDTPSSSGAEACEFHNERATETLALPQWWPS
jgi:hypothetical protein